MQGDNCLDATCYLSKVTALLARETAANPGLVQISTEWRPANDRPAGQLLPGEYRRVPAPKEAQGEAAEPACPHVTLAIVTHGNGVGERLSSCADQDCPVHRPRHSYTPDSDFEQRQQAAQQQREERQQQRDKRERALRALILRFPSTATDVQMRFLLKALVTADVESSLERIAARLDDDRTVNTASDDVCADVIDRLMPSSLIGFLAELALGSYVDLPQPEERDVLKEALDLFTVPKSAPTAMRTASKRTAKATAKKIAKRRA